ncbi:Vacuolar transporter chaperone 4 [Tetrabaena socialis]|uniref:Vacuolar transporter chaperone 4 n=1 Tax=Tetrabaena socialis TaxID=47790 RepID=A0A2J8ACF7_9CHLO|nr:Vacuolar transporter chaperone 4 [Tetrabaena socialis]|eukprot:PNH10183.1 Vacuolar transporter chaperone 4 [Tetrabaena socialis]
MASPAPHPLLNARRPLGGAGSYANPPPTPSSSPPPPAAAAAAAAAAPSRDAAVTPGELHRAGSLALLPADTGEHRLPPSLAHQALKAAALTALLPPPHHSHPSNGSGPYASAATSGASASTTAAGSPPLTRAALDLHRSAGSASASELHSAFGWQPGGDGGSRSKPAGGAYAPARCARTGCLGLLAPHSPPDGNGPGKAGAVGVEEEGGEAGGAGTFVQAYAAELGRVRGFLAGSLAELWRRAQQAGGRLRQAVAGAHSAEWAAAVGAERGGPSSGLAAGPGGSEDGSSGSRGGGEVGAELRALCRELRRECDEIGAELVQLEAFERFNSAAFAELGMRHDRAARVGHESPLAVLEARHLYHRGVQVYLLHGLTYDMVLVALSDVYEAVRRVHADLLRHEQPDQQQEGGGTDSGAGSGSASAQAWAPPDQFKRSTTKYWLDPRDVLRAKAAIVRHLPLLIFGRRSDALAPAQPRPRAASSHAPAPAPPPLSTPFAVQSSSLPDPAVPLRNSALASCLSSDLYGGGKYGTTHDAPAGMNGHAKHPPPQQHRQPPSHPPPPVPRRGTLDGAVLCDSSRISSVYFDNAALDVYHERLVRGDGASLVRIRWYGSSPPGPEATVFVERKRHRDAWTGEWSLKERAQLPHPAVPGYLAGAPIAGMAMAPVAMAFMVYALYMYRKRSAQILRRETVRFDDQRGPVLLVLLLLAVLVIAYVLTVKAATRAPW